jgi:predicted ATPase
MLTRLKISGFKNLVDVDIQFGPFTCVAGPNAAGKSNLFDAIQFLSALSDKTLIDAAVSMRNEGGKPSDLRHIFHHLGDKYAKEMSFEAEMLISKEGVDDLGQKAEASYTFLRYKVGIAYRMDETLPSLGGLELIEERLEHITKTDAPGHLKFPHDTGTWRKSVIHGRRTTPFISTENGESRIIKLHQDGVKGRARTFSASNLPRTVLSSVNAVESPTALLARREMQSWRLLQLEPSSLRESDSFTTPPGLGSDGSHLAATLYYLARKQSSNNVESWTYEQVTSRLSELIDDIMDIYIDRDEKRELLTLNIIDREGTVHTARSLSDGTLRFLALAVLAIDPEYSGLICMEEPENGIYPERIPAILRLLQDIATDTNIQVGSDNPLRQVIINTHSPAVVSQVHDDSLLVAELKEMVKNGKRFKRAAFSWLPDTWRNKASTEVQTISKGKLLAYLNPVIKEEQEDLKELPVTKNKSKT